MPLTEFFHVLNEAPYGAYAMDMQRTVLFWNQSVEQIAGYKASQVVGHQCYEVLYGLPEQPSVPNCTDGCFTLSLTEANESRRWLTSEWSAHRAGGSGLQ